MQSVSKLIARNFPWFSGITQKTSNISRITPQCINAPTASPFAFQQKDWRAVALSTPEIWTNINVGILSHHSPSGGNAQLLVLYLQRSGLRPLSLSMSMRLAHHRLETFPAFQVLLDSSSRWRSFMLSINLPVDPSLFDCTPALPNLRSVRISIGASKKSDAKDKSDHYGRLVAFFQDSPTLTHVTVSMPSGDSAGPGLLQRFALPLPHLLSVSAPLSTLAFENFDWLTNLHDCDLYINRGWPVLSFVDHA
ncbi:hypothetical protein VKT23_001298 [Stygiomarasmius scandens]|uniref:Uncharacterized protein n=1 Tax=Marasmiellus scandens TaxID=2682957 RepID=A0ABR1K952_9AGAR